LFSIFLLKTWRQERASDAYGVFVATASAVCLPEITLFILHKSGSRPNDHGQNAVPGLRPVANHPPSKSSGLKKKKNGDDAATDHCHNGRLWRVFGPSLVLRGARNIFGVPRGARSQYAAQQPL